MNQIPLSRFVFTLLSEGEEEEDVEEEAGDPRGGESIRKDRGDVTAWDDVEDSLFGDETSRRGIGGGAETGREEEVRRVPELKGEEEGQEPEEGREEVASCGVSGVDGGGG